MTDDFIRDQAGRFAPTGHCEPDGGTDALSATAASAVPRFVKPVTCPRCQGKGFGEGWRPQSGTCFRCDGVGTVEGDRATIVAKKAAEAERTAFYNAARDHSVFAFHGLTTLATNEPERVEKALAAWRAGDPRVLPALDELGRPWRKR